MVLRGPILESWVRRKDRQMDRRFLQALVQNAADSTRPVKASRLSKTDRVKSFLLIADVMWESNELVPELEKIAPVKVLDLGRKISLGDDGASFAGNTLAVIREFSLSTKGYSPDVVLLYARPSLLSDEVFEEIRSCWKCPLLGMNLDDKVQFFPYGVFKSGDDNYQKWAAHFDLNLTSSLTALRWYRQKGFPSLYIAMGYHLSASNSSPPANVDYRYAVSFVGSRKRERRAMIEELQGMGIAITLFGRGWPDSKWVDCAADVYRQSQINLGLGFATSTGGIANLKARDFECPGAGACYLTTYNWELATHYDIGREILCYRSTEELVEMYLYYSARPDECLRIAQAAHKRCAAEHTWERRFRRALHEAGFAL